MVLGKILGSATLAWIQGLIFLAFAPLAKVSHRLRRRVAVVGAVFLVSFTLTGLGFVIAWQMTSTSGFHAIMNLLLVPMWMVSGSLFPMATAHGWIKGVMWVNPLTYSISLLNGLLKLSSGAPGIGVSLLVTACFGVVLLLASGMVANRRAREQRMTRRPHFLACSSWPYSPAAKPAPARLLADPRLPTHGAIRPTLRQQIAGGRHLGGGFHLHHVPRPLPAHELANARRAIGRRIHARREAGFLHRGSEKRYARQSSPPTPNGIARNPAAGSSSPAHQTALNDLCRNGFKLGDVDGSLTHSTRFVLIDRHSRVRGFYNPASEDGAMPHLLHDIHALEKESDVRS